MVTISLTSLIILIVLFVIFCVVQEYRIEKRNKAIDKLQLDYSHLAKNAKNLVADYDVLVEILTEHFGEQKTNNMYLDKKYGGK